MRGEFQWFDVHHGIKCSFFCYHHEKTPGDLRSHGTSLERGLQIPFSPVIFVWFWNSKVQGDTVSCHSDVNRISHDCICIIQLYPEITGGIWRERWRDLCTIYLHISYLHYLQTKNISPHSPEQTQLLNLTHLHAL